MKETRARSRTDGTCAVTDVRETTLCLRSAVVTSPWDGAVRRMEGRRCV